MTIRLFTAFLIVLGLLPATASAAPTCPDDNADELGGSGAVYGVGSNYVISGAPQTASGAGAIVVRNGTRPPHTITLAQVPGAGAPAAGDGFGGALTTGMLLDGRPCTDILAGAPGRGGTGAAVAIGGRRGDGDHLTRDLWIGAPGRDVAGHADAGTVYHYALTDAGQVSYVGVVTQGSPQAPDTAEAGDRFGAAVVDAFNGYAAGAPGEDLRGRRDAGLVELFTSRLRPRRTYRAGARGVPGRLEAGDRFGSALASGIGIDCQESIPLAIGVPGRDLHGARDAGGITLIGGGDITDCGSRELSQGHGLAGRPHRNARVGTTLGIAQDRPGLDEDEYDSLLVGIPAGGILTLRDGYPRLRGRLGRPRGTSDYGSVFTLAAPD
jgi:hypothetical protein